LTNGGTVVKKYVIGLFLGLLLTAGVASPALSTCDPAADNAPLIVYEQHGCVLPYEDLSHFYCGPDADVQLAPEASVSWDRSMEYSGPLHAQCVAQNGNVHLTYDYNMEREFCCGFWAGGWAGAGIQPNLNIYVRVDDESDFVDFHRTDTGSYSCSHSGTGTPAFIRAWWGGLDGNEIQASPDNPNPSHTVNGEEAFTYRLSTFPISVLDNARWPGVRYALVRTISSKADWLTYRSFGGDGGVTTSAMLHIEVDVNVQVVDGGEPPIAVIDGPSTAVVAVPVSFTGEASFDPDGDPLAYEWMAEGSPTINGVNDPICQMTWAEPGTYVVYLTVKDCDAMEATEEHEVIVTGVCDGSLNVDFGGWYSREIRGHPGFEREFRMDATFDPPCRCCEYRQFLRFRKWILDPANPLPPREPAIDTGWFEDGFRHPYGHRFDFPNEPGDMYLPTREDGSDYNGSDHPHSAGPAGAEVIWNTCFEMRLQRVANPGCEGGEDLECVIPGTVRQQSFCAHFIYGGQASDCPSLPQFDACTNRPVGVPQHPPCIGSKNSAGRRVNIGGCEVELQLAVRDSVPMLDVIAWCDAQNDTLPVISVLVNGQAPTSDYGPFIDSVGYGGEIISYYQKFPRDDGCEFQVQVTVNGETANEMLHVAPLSDDADFENCVAGATAPAPGNEYQGGWYRVLADGGAYGEIQDAVSVNGNALHEFAPASNPCGAQTIDGHEVFCSDLGGLPFVTLEADFLARCSNLNATNPYTASLACESYTSSICEMIGFSANGGNGETRLATGVSVGASCFNGVDNNQPLPLQVGQHLAWDTWHHVKVAIDQGGDRYLYIEVNGERQNLTEFRPPQGEAAGVWSRGQTLERLLAQVISCPWEAPNFSDDHIYWDNIELRTESSPTSVEQPTQEVALPTSWSIAAFNRPGAAQVEMSCKVPATDKCWVKVFSVRGELVRNVYQGEMQAGEQRIFWDGRDTGGRTVSAGIYLIHLSNGRDGASTKVLLLR